MWIKICGNTSLADAQLSVDCGADALGFIFAESPRRITPAMAGAITVRLPETVERYGVFVDPSLQEVIETVEQAGLTGVQLHTTSDPLLPRKLREHFFDGSPVIIRVLHFNEQSLGQEIAALRDNTAIDAMMIDSRTALAVGGTGVRFDWQKAEEMLRQATTRLRLIVAGGLSPENVGEAIDTLRPWGVDVVTGVEASPGRKDADKVRRFIEQARGAASRSACAGDSTPV